jgi:hypothetical protein
MRNSLIIIFALCVTLAFTPEKGTRTGDNGNLSGAVTFKFSIESTVQPDEGCEIYAISEADVRSTRYADITDRIGLFQRNKNFYMLTISNTIDPEKIEKARDNFFQLAEYAWKTISGFQELPAMARAKTNSSGKYSLSLKPGRYYILYVSGNLRNKNMAESRGLIDYKVLDIKPTRETIQHINFDKHANMMVMQITAIAAEGC